MRFGGRRTSGNVESQRGQSFGGGGFGGGRGGGLGGLVFGLVLNRFGIGGLLVLFAVTMLLGDPIGLLGGGGGGQQTAVAPHQARQAGRPAGDVCAEDEVTRFSCQVLASTEDRWSEVFQAAGQRYEPPRLVFYDGRGMSGCGAAQAAMGPFYCPSDRRIYLDTTFFRELERRHGAPGDFAQAYVIAHEVGHHIQTITGIARDVRQAQARASQAEANALQVRMELQADCYAGVWAALERGAMEPGDLEEGLRAAEAIGDDTLQRAAGRRVVPESFTHGTSAQRREWLRRGFDAANPDACDTFSARI
ncbi:MAG: neutral zinc metallopeptidase [Allosphingosinicella sp.]|uniref:KPN_02809 family neutral zinc metallopeptidase n=1 Tax=Allosphingosinicella sp. TaxID=2823234 RepID=UPI003938F780